jgi:uncharacterized membrane protein
VSNFFLTERSEIPDFLVHGGAGDGGGGSLALLDELLAKLSNIVNSGGPSEWFPGILELGLNVHPMLVHFPIAFLSLFLLLEIAGAALGRESLRRAAAVMLHCGAAGAILASAAGLYAESVVPHGQTVHDVMEWHKRFGLTTTGLALVLSVWRLASESLSFSQMAQALYFTLATLMTVSMIFGADLGGLMVYRHGVAVQSLQQPDPSHHHNAVVAPPETPPPARDL